MKRYNMLDNASKKRNKREPRHAELVSASSIFFPSNEHRFRNKFGMTILSGTSRVAFFCLLFALCSLLIGCSQQQQQDSAAQNTTSQPQQQSTPPVEEKKQETTEPKFDESFGDTVNLVDLKQWPVPTFQTPPVFPEEARMSGIKASVYLKVLVSKMGKPLAVEIQWVKTASIYADTSKQLPSLVEWEDQFKQPSIDAVMLWQFTQPLMASGKPENVWVNVPLEYNLTK